MTSYKIACSKIHIMGNNDYLNKRMEPFLNDDYTAPEMCVEIERCSHIDEPAGDLIVDDYVRWLRKTDSNEGFHIYRKDESNNNVLAVMDTDRSWSRIKITCLEIKIDPHIAIKPEWADWCEFYSFLLLGVAFRNHLLSRNGITIHSSSIAWNSKGVLFTAPSGTGKSTHVRLWEQYLGGEVRVVNDDTPAIRFEEGIPMLCGTPWSGSSDKFLNIMIPLNTIVVLEQAPENTIKKLSPVEALPRIMPRVFLPYFDEGLMEKAYDLIGRLIQSVPVYLLKCRPDKEAMEMVYECVR